MQGLLAERVPIRNQRMILETLAENAGRSQDPAVLQGQVRIALGRQIIQDIAGAGAEVPVMSLDADLERLLQGALSNAGSTLEPGLAEKLQQKLAESTRRREVAGEPAILLVPPTLRAPLASFVRSSVPGLHVLAWNEIPHNRKVRLVTTVGR